MNKCKSKLLKAKSEIEDVTHIIKEGVIETQRCNEQAVVDMYNAIENTVVGTYKMIETGVVGGYKKIEGKFVEKFLEEEKDKDLFSTDEEDDFFNLDEIKL